MVVAGFSDGVVRFVRYTVLNEAASFFLVVVAKPHAVPIITLAINPEGDRICTSAADNTVFFFDIEGMSASQNMCIHV